LFHKFFGVVLIKLLVNVLDIREAIGIQKLDDPFMLNTLRFYMVPYNLIFYLFYNLLSLCNVVFVTCSA